MGERDSIRGAVRLPGRPPGARVIVIALDRDHGATLASTAIAPAGRTPRSAVPEGLR